MKKFLKIVSLALVSVMAAVMLVACAPSTVDKAKDKMEDAGYNVVTAIKVFDSEGYVGGITASKSIEDDDSWFGDVISITAYLFETPTDAKAYADAWGKRDVKAVTVSGKWAYVGDEEAVKDFLK